MEPWQQLQGIKGRPFNWTHSVKSMERHPALVSSSVYFLNYPFEHIWRRNPCSVKVHEFTLGIRPKPNDGVVGRFGP
jgi:hypothetical protein